MRLRKTNRHEVSSYVSQGIGEILWELTWGICFSLKSLLVARISTTDPNPVSKFSSWVETQVSVFSVGDKLVVCQAAWYISLYSVETGFPILRLYIMAFAISRPISLRQKVPARGVTVERWGNSGRQSVRNKKTPEDSLKCVICQPVSHNYKHIFS